MERDVCLQLVEVTFLLKKSPPPRSSVGVEVYLQFGVPVPSLMEGNGAHTPCNSHPQNGGDLIHCAACAWHTTAWVYLYSLLRNSS